MTASKYACSCAFNRRDCVHTFIICDIRFLNLNFLHSLCAYIFSWGDHCGQVEQNCKEEDTGKSPATLRTPYGLGEQEWRKGLEAYAKKFGSAFILLSTLQIQSTQSKVLQTFPLLPLGITCETPERLASIPDVLGLARHCKGNPNSAPPSQSIAVSDHIAKDW